MSNQDKLMIYEVLDMFNEAVGYKGLNNEGKKTSDRDDIITRQLFNHWVNDYNKKHDRKIKGIYYNQRHHQWYRSDIQKLLETDEVKEKLNKAYLRKTVPLFDWPGFDSERVSVKRKAQIDKRTEESNSQGLMESLENVMEKIIGKILDTHVEMTFNGNVIDAKKYIDKKAFIESFVDKEILEDEAMKITENYYLQPVYDVQGNIEDVTERGRIRKTEEIFKNI